MPPKPNKSTAGAESEQFAILQSTRLQAPRQRTINERSDLLLTLAQYGSEELRDKITDAVPQQVPNAKWDCGVITTLAKYSISLELRNKVRTARRNLMNQHHNPSQSSGIQPAPSPWANTAQSSQNFRPVTTPPAPVYGAPVTPFAPSASTEPQNPAHERSYTPTPRSLSGSLLDRFRRQGDPNQGQGMGRKL